MPKYADMHRGNLIAVYFASWTGATYCDVMYIRKRQ